MKKNDKTTIIFVNKNQQAKRPIQVPTSFIKNWKWFVIGLFSSFVLLLSTIVYLTYSGSVIQKTKDRLAQDLLQRKKEWSKIDTSALRKQYLSLNQKLSKLNQLLKAKGIKTVQIEHVGGEENADLLSTTETGAFYNNYLNKFIFSIDRMPIGYPYPGKITSNFGYRENPFTGQLIETHKGVDIKAAYGSIVNSTAGGMVSHAAYKGGYGNLVVLSHGNGFETYYGHLSKITVKKGQSISSGQMIGKVGSTGRSTGPHLHYEVHQNGIAINPRTFLSFK